MFIENIRDQDGELVRLALCALRCLEDGPKGLELLLRRKLFSGEIHFHAVEVRDLDELLLLRGGWFLKQKYCKSRNGRGRR